MGYLTQQLTEHKRMDTTSSALNGGGSTEYALANVPPKEPASTIGSGIQVVLTPDREGRKQQRHKTKLQYQEKGAW